MSVLSSNRQQTLYAQIQTSARVVPNTTGVWTNTGVKKLRYNSFTVTPQNAINTPTYKTGKRSPMIEFAAVREWPGHCRRT